MKRIVFERLTPPFEMGRIMMFKVTEDSEIENFTVHYNGNRVYHSEILLVNPKVKTPSGYYKERHTLTPLDSASEVCKDVIDAPQESRLVLLAIGNFAGLMSAKVEFDATPKGAKEETKVKPEEKVDEGILDIPKRRIYKSRTKKVVQSSKE